MNRRRRNQKNTNRPSSVKAVGSTNRSSTDANRRSVPASRHRFRNKLKDTVTVSLRKMSRFDGLAITAVTAVVVLLACLLGFGPNEKVGVDKSTEEFSLRIAAAAEFQDLPVKIDRIRTCWCTDGPRGQLQQKFKFGITNDTGDSLKIGGGPTSNIRLIVAYRGNYQPIQTVPIKENVPWVGVGLVDFPGVSATIAHRIGTMAPVPISGPASAFGLTDDWHVYALSPNSNLLVETNATLDKLSATTYVTQETVGPGEEYYSTRRGAGVWVFYVPTNRDTAPQRSLGDNYVILGVGAVSNGRDGSLIGFSPVPPTTVRVSINDI